MRLGVRIREVSAVLRQEVGKGRARIADHARVRLVLIENDDNFVRPWNRAVGHRDG